MHYLSGILIEITIMASAKVLIPLCCICNCFLSDCFIVLNFLFYYFLSVKNNFKFDKKQVKIISKNLLLKILKIVKTCFF